MTEQENLELQIKTYDANYRAGTPICTDEAYDGLIEELRNKFPDSELLKKGVIKQKQKVNRKVKLPLPMFSLNKVKSASELKQWLISANIPDEELLIITPKFDGISLVVNEKTSDCITRGDGEYGQESTRHYLNSRGLRLDYRLTEYHSYGEAIMSKKNFEKYRDRFANPRNMVAGLFNRDEPVNELKDVDYIRYGCSLDKCKSDQIGELNLLNTVQCKYLVVSCKEILNHTDEFLEESFTRLYKEWGEDYQIDGLVVDINSKELRTQLGREENMNPRYARAIKLPGWSQSADVRVTGITWQVSKQGKLKPVIQIEPTEIAGVVISNVTGYNAQYVLDNNIARNSIIRIVRSGDVIPKHIETISFVQDYTYDLFDSVSECPSCGEPTKWDDTFTELICTNPGCKEKQIAKLVHFFSVLEVEDFGEPSIRRFYEAGFNSIENILSMGATDMVTIAGFGIKSSSVLLNQFKRLRNDGISFAKLLHALDFFEGKIGEKTVQLIFDTVDWKDIKNIETLKSIEGVAEISANIFMNGMNRWWNSGYELSLPIYVTYIRTPKQEPIGDRYKDMKICFTGVRPTKEQEQEIKSQGGEIVSGVSNKTTHLVVKDINSTSSKMQKAKELGVKIITINELWK